MVEIHFFAIHGSTSELPCHFPSCDYHFVHLEHSNSLSLQFLQYFLPSAVEYFNVLIMKESVAVYSPKGKRNVVLLLIA